MKKYLFLILALLSPISVCAEDRINNVQGIVDAAGALKAGQAIAGGGGEAVSDIMRTITSQLISGNEFTKISNYAKDIEETYVNIESTTDGIKNATTAALAAAATTQDYTSLLEAESGSTEAVLLDVPQSSIDAGKTYVKEKFFVDIGALKEGDLETVKMQEAKDNRTQLYKDNALDVFAYSQAYLTAGKEDFETRLETIHNMQKNVTNEAAGIAVTTVALKNIIQETMLQVVLEQKQLKLEAIQNLQTQNIKLLPASSDEAKERCASK